MLLNLNTAHFNAATLPCTSDPLNDPKVFVEFIGLGYSARQSTEMVLVGFTPSLPSIRLLKATVGQDEGIVICGELFPIAVMEPIGVQTAILVTLCELVAYCKTIERK